MRLIDVDELKKEINQFKFDTENDAETVWIKIGLAKIVDAAEVVHGEWVWKDGCFHCTNCKQTEDHITKYCPGCGVKMDGGSNNE